MIDSGKKIDFRDVDEFIKRMNALGPELSKFILWAQHMSPEGLRSLGPKMTKNSLSEMVRKIRGLEAMAKPMKRAIRNIRDSGHFDQKNIVPLFFTKGA